MRPRLHHQPNVLAVSFFLLASSTASAQGLIAFPWKECPKLITGEFRCVWVALALETVPIRPREHTDRTFEMNFMNPGSDPANVIMRFFGSGGEAVGGVDATVTAGQVRRMTSTDHRGYFVAQSDRPVLVWAWGWEEKLAEGGAASDRPPTAISAHSIQVIPIDCNLEDSVSKNFAFVCGVTSPSPK
jgi:hypothetical protein